MSAKAALIQFDHPARPSPRHPRTVWPTRADVQLTKTYKLLNLSERRFGAHIAATGVRRYIGGVPD